MMPGGFLEDVRLPDAVNFADQVIAEITRTL
jgi:hypothetical protein